MRSPWPNLSASIAAKPEITDVSQVVQRPRLDSDHQTPVLQLLQLLREVNGGLDAVAGRAEWQRE